MKYKKGFTLMEILISMGIIAIMVVIGLVSYASVNRRSRDTKRKADIEQVRSALELYKSDFGYYPGLASGGSWAPIADLRSYLVTNSYISALPEDPKDITNNYYQISMTNSAPDAGGTTRYYGYCLSAVIEQGGTTSCTVSLSLPTTPVTYTYGVPNP